MLITLLLYPFILSYILYAIHMVKTKKTKWIRDCSSYKNEEQVKMWNDGLEYIKQYKDKIEPVDIYNGKLHLFGEFVNIGTKKTVIIMGGRCECLYYSYYYAKPYLENDVNVLVIDSRAHGLSDGKINTAGFKEADDLLCWVKFIHDKYNQEEIYLQGTCIGSATTIYLLSNPDCPSYVTKVVADSLFRTYYETFWYHMVELKRPTKPYIDITFTFYKWFGKVDAKNDGPIYRIDKLKENTKILFLQSLEDKYVFKEHTLELYEKCNLKEKEYHFLKYGNHSHIRINQVEEYDNYIIDFIKQK